jgi:hypothetical protein
MITKNINVFKGAINGGIARMTFLTFNDNKMIIVILIKFVSTNIYLNLSR